MPQYKYSLESDRQEEYCDYEIYPGNLFQKCNYRERGIFPAWILRFIGPGYDKNSADESIIGDGIFSFYATGWFYQFPGLLRFFPGDR